MASTSVPSLFRDSTVVDCDVHVLLRHPSIMREIAKRLEEPYRRQLDPGDQTEGIYKSPYHVADGFPKSIPGKIEGIRVDVTEPADVTGPLCDQFGIDYPIVNSLIKLDSIPDTDLANQLMRVCNDVLVERFLDDTDFFGLCRVTTKSPRIAADEIDRMADEDSIVGVLIHNGETEKPEGDPRNDPIYRAAQDNDLPVVFHTTSDASMNWKTPPLLRDFRKYAGVHALAHPMAHMMTVTSLVMEGVPEKFPELEFVNLESGLGWVPYMMYRMNREYNQRPSDAPLLEKQPEEYVRENFYFGTQPLEEPMNRTELQSIIEALGADSIVFSSDHPHFDFDTPVQFGSYLHEFSEAERERILHGNATDVFDLPI